MDTEVKEEADLSELTSQNGTEKLALNIKHDTSAWNNDCEMEIKREIKQEASFVDIYVSDDNQLIFKEPIATLKPCNDDSEVDTNMESKKWPGSENDKECFSKDLKLKTCSYGDVCETEIKEEPRCTESILSVAIHEGLKGDIDSSKSPRSYTEVVSGKSSIFPDIDIPEHLSLNTRTDGSDCRKTKTCESSLSGASIGMKQNHVSEEDITCKSTLAVDKSRPFTCQICARTFIRLSHLKQHKLIHETGRPHQCEICGKSFLIFSHLKGHKLIHGDSKHKCDFCDKAFTRLSDLKRHNLTHKSTKPHKCDICEKRFNQLAHLKMHYLLHISSKTYKCDICGKSFSHVTRLKKHHLTHSGATPYKCEICDKSFRHPSFLKQHYVIHDAAKRHKCAVCEKTFTTMFNLKQHNLIHQGVKPYKCEVCQKSFTQSSTLKQHNQIHEGGVLHKCELCDKSFRHLSSLRKHKLIHKSGQ